MFSAVLMSFSYDNNLETILALKTHYLLFTQLFYNNWQLKLLKVQKLKLLETKNNVGVT